MCPMRSIFTRLTANQTPLKRKSELRKASRHRLRPLQVFESLEVRSLMAVDMLSFDASSYDSSRFLIQFRTSEAGSALVGSTVGGATITRRVSSDGWYQAKLTPGATLASAMQAYSSRNDVLAAAPDFRVRLSAVPNDPSYSSLWGMENNGVGGTLDADIDASQAWSFGTSSSVVVGVIDTGIDYNHVDLAANIWTNSREIAGNGIDDDRNGYADDTRGWNFVANNNNPMDDNGHGTHVAGTIGAVGNNGIGVAGVAWNVKLMPLKFLDATGSGMLSDAVEAIDYARANGAKIINASWGGGGFSSALQSAILRFQNAGGIFVAAAGNESANNAVTASFPANYNLTNVISVAASTRTDTLASFSNYGTNVDIAAPGASILSTIPGNRYATYSGTSMATPHVAGAMALLWGQAPTLTAAQLISTVMSNTDAVLTGSTIYGRLNVGKAAAALAGNTGGGGGGTVDTTSPYVTSAVWNQTATNVSSVDVTFSETIRSTSLTAASVQLTGPSGAIAISSIVALNNGSQYRISFASQTLPGTYSLTLLPTITDAVGNLLNQDRDTTAGEATQDRFVSTTNLTAVTPPTQQSFTRNGPVTIADATATRSSTTNITLDVPSAFTISDLNVNVSIDHTYVSDLRIRLIGPDGTTVTLVNRRAGSRDNLRVVFDDEATTSVATTPGNLSGTFRPEQSLAAFDGKNAQGRWTLEVTDFARIDVGTLNSFSLQFTSAATTASARPAAGGTSSVSNSNMLANLMAFSLDLMEQWLKRRNS